MSKIQINELRDTLTQEIRLEQSVRYTIGGLYPWLYMHNAPAGTFTIDVLSGPTVRASQTFTSATIKSALGTSHNYATSWHPIIFTNPTQLEAGTYSVRLSASGYTYSPSSFLAWCQQHENLVNSLDYTPLSDAENPLALRVKILRNY